MTQTPPLRVLLWSPQGSSEQYHGPGSFAYRLYSLANPEEVHVTLAHANPAQPDVDLFREQHAIPGNRGVWGTFSFLRNSRRWLQSHAPQFDVLHGLSAYHRTVQPAFQAHRLGLPSVIFVTSHRQELVDKPGLRGLLGWAKKRREMVRQLDGLIAMSSAINDELLEYGLDPRRIARIPMGVNTDRFRPVSSRAEQQEIRRELGLPDRPTVLFVGSLIRRKRPHLLVQAMGVLAKSGVDCQLVIVGPPNEPEYHAEIEAMIRAEQLQEHVRQVGFTPQVERYHQAADLFALPASIEGMPAALVEAMSCGLACIGTAISGISDLIDDGTTGFIIEPTVESIADALNEYLTHPELIAEHGEVGRARILERYSASAVLQAYLKLFRCVKEGRDACEASTLPCLG